MTPILYSFRRCPYAMRARLALLSANLSVEIREISLKNKPLELKVISKKATVPCLQTEKKIFAESLEIMYWVLGKSDQEQLLDISLKGINLIKYNDGPFKTCLDRTKYHAHYDNVELAVEHKIAKEFLSQLNEELRTEFILGEKRTLVDLALLPFIRQYAFIDKRWFDAQNWSNLNRWLNSFLRSKSFAISQRKYPIWNPGDKPTIF
ncbi:MAG: glutathione S-transferase N-terminal domain-containing protein [Paracoccaceae bacterium]|nr:glutathione S-transferase N-terminal domain-containing protein [Paracoccaceae bacterium]